MIIDANESKALNRIKETKFLNALNSLYQDIVNDEGDYLSIRKTCNEGILNAFSHVGYHIKGLENLPLDSGHIFILNHHKIDPFLHLRQSVSNLTRHQPHNRHYCSTLS